MCVFILLTYNDNQNSISTESIHRTMLQEMENEASTVVLVYMETLGPTKLS